LRLETADHQLEYSWYGQPPNETPTLVFLHEGLGCVEMWGDYPSRLAESTGCGALVYSRAGYGRSSPIALPRNVRFMHDEAMITLPRVLDVMEVRGAVLVGHSDGGSIALIHGGTEREARVRGFILEAPHVFTEEVCINSINRAAYR
jgi:pimeloyl-ACP methyl ester carboxylesterase